MTNELTHKYLKRIRNISAALFFVHIITLIVAILFPIVFTVWLSSSTIIDPSINQFDPTIIASTIFSVLFIVLGIASLILEIVNIVHCCLVKINNEMIVILIIFSALSLLLIVIAPLLTWIFAVKSRKKLENLQTAEWKKSREENLAHATKEV